MSYNAYIGKHIARMRGLLASSKVYVKTKKIDKVKYFTLCATSAIDIFMLEKDNILKRDNKGRLNNVIICESNTEDAKEIFKLVRPPLFESVLVGALQDIILFEDDKYTEGRSYDEDEPDIRIRRKLRIKDLHKRFKGELPFDIINFDTYGNILGCEDDDKKLMRCFAKLFELQKDADSFLLTITLPLDNICEEYKNKFQKSINTNIVSYDQIKDKIKQIWNAEAYSEIKDICQHALGFSKSILMKIANENNWCSHHDNIIIYENRNKNKMMALTVVLEKTTTPDFTDTYVNDIINIIEKFPEYISFNQSLKNKKAKQNLNKIKEYRDNFKKQNY